MNAYTEIGFKGENIGLLFGLGALAAIEKDLDLMVGQNEVNMSIGYFSSVIEAGYLNNCSYEKIKPKYFYKDFYTYLENTLLESKKVPEDFISAHKVYTESKDGVGKIMVVDEKKKLDRLDWDEVFSICLALGHDYKIMTWPDYQRLLEGYNYIQSRKAEHTRAICYYTVLPYLPEGNRPSMQDFWPLRTDPVKEPEDPDQTLSQIRMILKEYENKN